MGDLPITPTEARCPHCGAPLRPITVRVAGREIACGLEPCGCPGAIAERQRMEAAERARGEDDARRERRARYLRAGIPRKFVGLDADVDAALREVLSGRSLYLQGDNGRGKSVFAAVLAMRAIDRGRSALYTSSSRMKGELFSTGRDWTEEDLFRRWSMPWLLVIDDIGKECDNRAVVPMLYRVVNERDEQERPVVVTSNYTRRELGERLAQCGDESCARAIVSRLFGMCREAVDFGGADRRLAWRG